MTDRTLIDTFSDIPPQAVGSGQTRQGDIKSTRVEVIATADDKINVSEPSSPTHSQAPWNKTEVTLSGHLRELDDTPGAERIHEMHRSGTFYEIHPDGTLVFRIYGDNFHIALKDNNLVVGGNLNITVQGDANILTKGNLTHKVGGNMKTIVLGDMTTIVNGVTSLYSKGDMNIQTKANLKIRSALTTEFQTVGQFNIKSDGNLVMRAGSVGTVYAKDKLYLDGKEIHENMPGKDPDKSKLKDSYPGVGLNIPDSVIEPSVETLMIVRTDNAAISSINSTDLTFPKDRTKVT